MNCNQLTRMRCNVVSHWIHIIRNCTISPGHCTNEAPEVPPNRTILLRKSRAGVVFERSAEQSKTNEPRRSGRQKNISTVKANDDHDVIDSTTNEHEHLKKIDSRRFGSLAAEKGLQSKFVLDAERLPNDPDHYDQLIGPADKRSRNFYLHSIHDAIYSRKHAGVREAFELFEQAKQERKLIDRKWYAMLIKGCAVIGHVDKALELRKECQQRNIRLSQPMVTSLFATFAHCEPQPDSIEKLNRLKDDLTLEQYVFNVHNYHALIKAYGKLDDFETACELMNEMHDKQFDLQTETFNMLLTASCERAHDGLLQSLKLIREMQNQRFTANIHTFVFLLKAIRTCGVGSREHLMTFLANEQIDMNHMQQLDLIGRKNNNVEIQMIAGDSVDGNVQLIDSKKEIVHRLSTDEPIQVIESNNLTSVTSPTLVDIDVTHFNTPQKRFALIGGLPGLFGMMRSAKVKPSVRLITQLIPVMPNTHESAISILNLIKEHKLTADTGLFNALIKQSARRQDFKSARQLLTLMVQHHVTADLITFGSISLICRQPKYAVDLLKDMQRNQLKPNVVIFGQLVKNACQLRDVDHVKWLLERMSYEHVRPDEKLIEHLFELRKQLSHELSKQEHRVETNSIIDDEKYMNFCRFLDKWMLHSPLDARLDFLKQFDVPKAPSNEKLHEFKAMMTNLIKQKEREISKRK